MLSDFLFLAQATESTQFKFLYLLAILVGCVALPMLIGQYVAKRLRMPDHAWKISLVLITLAMAGTIVYRAFDWDTKRFNIPLGVDLKGGVILIYEVDESATLAAADPNATDDQDSIARGNLGSLVEALTRRINPSGTKEIVVRPYGERQVEIIIPEVEQREVDQIKKAISTAGVLQFRIVANPRDHERLIAMAEEMAKDPARKRSRALFDDAGNQIALWARVGREPQEGGGGTFKLSVAGNTIRDASTGDLIEVAPSRLGDDEVEFTRYIAGLGIKEIDVLMAMDDTFDVTGSHLGAVSRGNDENLRPCIFFNLKTEGGGVRRFASLTSEYGPQGGFNRQLGIVLDNTLLSAPNIQEPITQGRGRITGQFTEEEVDFMVNILEAGSLPVILNPNPISENQINPLLGRETIQQGKFAIVVSLVLVLVFILFYYRFAGVVACLALLANLLFIFALMILIKAAFTLPGLAGLVLTVGMSVDANVLIFERIREELARGAGLRMAIRNGFGRATTTIIDANITTLITAIVLYLIGTDQIRGFAVTLILGILMSMYTAIFCSRLIFDIAERAGWLTRLHMMQLLSATHIDFIGKRYVAAAVSAIVIAVGLVAIGMRQSDMLDIDLNGGTSVQMRLQQPMDTEEVRRRLTQQFAGSSVHFTVTAMNNRAGADTDTFKVDSDLQDVEQLEQAIHDAFELSDGKSGLATYSLTYSGLREVAAVSPDATTPATSESDKAAEESTALPATSTQGLLKLDEDNLLALAEDARVALAQADTSATDAAQPEVEPTSDASTPAAEVANESEVKTLDADQAKEPPPGASASTDEPAGPASTADEATESKSVASDSSLVQVDLKFAYPINAQTLQGEIEEAAEKLNLPISAPELLNPNWDGTSSNAYQDWTLRVAGSEEQVRGLLESLQAKFADTPVWPASNKIGSQVAERMQRTAIAAVLACLFGIVVYIWIRFQRVGFGVAAVVALVHDVLVTLGAIAVSAWLASALGFLLIEEFKISLPIVAALLTIIGYSLNDTIVIFDRIREVRGKSPELTGEMINRSINETLSRTLLTSLTTLLVVVILYAMGGDGIHGFAFSLVVGVVAGTYSTIFIASPVLLWLVGSKGKGKPKAAAA